MYGMLERDHYNPRLYIPVSMATGQDETHMPYKATKRYQQFTFIPALVSPFYSLTGILYEMCLQHDAVYTYHHQTKRTRE